MCSAKKLKQVTNPESEPLIILFNILMVKTSTFPWWENLILSGTKCYLDGGMY
jgi:hypothetical protein